jgi:polyhydroxybutyrate depolymerase
VFAGGLSSGGFFSNTLGCQRGDVLRGIAPVSAGPRDMNNCKGNVAAWIADGKNDELVSPRQGMSARDFWLNRNGCSTSNPRVIGDATNCVAYDGCKAGFPVQWCLHDGGHFWPRSANLGLWTFFSKL